MGTRNHHACKEKPTLKCFGMQKTAANTQTTQNNHSYQFLGSDNFSEDVYCLHN